MENYRLTLLPTNIDILKDEIVYSLFNVFLLELW